MTCTPDQTKPEKMRRLMHQTEREIVRTGAMAGDDGGFLRLAGGEEIANVHAGNAKPRE